MDTSSPPFVILGCGYVGTRLAQSLLADGVKVRVCARRVALLEPLRQLGADVHYFDASRPHQFGPALLGLDQPVVVYSIPGVRDLPQGEAVRRAATASYRVHARAFIYLGSSAVYGRSEGNDNSEWVDEESTVAAGDPEASIRLAEEAAVQSVAQGGLRTITLRLAAIYGPTLMPSQPGRGVRQRLRSGQYKLWDGGRYYFSRIHVDDLARVIRAAATRAASGRPTSPMYVVGDDHPCPQGEYAAWLSQHLGVPLPPSMDSHLASGPGHVIRGRRLRNQRLKRELELSLLYPSYREGETEIDQVEGSGMLPVLRMSAGGAATAEATAPSKPPPPPLPLAQAGIDFGVAVGGSPIGAALVSLKPAETREGGPLYLVLSGKLTVERDGFATEAGPRSLIPPGALLRNAGTDPVELIALTAKG